MLTYGNLNDAELTALLKDGDEAAYELSLLSLSVVRVDV